MTGFQTLLICMLGVPTCLFHEVSLQFVTEKYFYLMTSCILSSFLLSLLSYIISLNSSDDQLSAKGNTGESHRLLARQIKFHINLQEMLSLISTMEDKLTQSSLEPISSCRASDSP